MKKGSEVTAGTLLKTRVKEEKPVVIKKPYPAEPGSGFVSAAPEEPVSMDNDIYNFPRVKTLYPLKTREGKKYLVYTVKRGDNLFTIAIRFYQQKVWRKLLTYNPVLKKRYQSEGGRIVKIYPGDKIYLPLIINNFNISNK